MRKRKPYDDAKFNAASAIEREYIQKLAKQLGTNYIAAPEKCSYDAVMAKNGIVSIVEAKVRQHRHNEFPTVLIEKAKFDKLITYIDGNMCHRALYICFYTDNKAVIFNLEKIDPKWTTDDFVKTTMGDRSKVSKRVAYLNLEDATIININ